MLLFAIVLGLSSAPLTGVLCSSYTHLQTNVVRVLKSLILPRFAPQVAMAMKSEKERFHVARSAPDRPAGTDPRLVHARSNDRRKRKPLQSFIPLRKKGDKLQNMKRISKRDAGGIKP